MTDQARPQIPLPSGYRVMPAEDQKLFDAITEIGNKTGEYCNAVSNSTGDGCDLKPSQIQERARWAAIARTQLQQGFMALKRAVALPSNF